MYKKYMTYLVLTLSWIQIKQMSANAKITTSHSYIRSKLFIHVCTLVCSVWIFHVRAFFKFNQGTFNVISLD